MSRTEEQLTRLFQQSFPEEGADEPRWEATRSRMRAKVRVRRTVLAACVVLVAVVMAAVPSVLSSFRSGPDVGFADLPAVEEDVDPQVEATPYTDKPFRVAPSAEETLDEPSAPAAEPSPTPSPETDDSADSAERASPEWEGTTDWYTVHLDEEIDPHARYFSAWRAMDALVAAMRVADQATVTHGVSDAEETSASGWVEITDVPDDSIAAEEIRVEILRDDQGWHIQPVGQGRASCRRGVDHADPSRCV